MYLHLIHLVNTAMVQKSFLGLQTLTYHPAKLPVQNVIMILFIAIQVKSAYQPFRFVPRLADLSL